MRMKYLIIPIFIFLSIVPVKGQEIYVSGGMGYNYITMEKLNDFLRYNWNFSNRRDDAHSAIEFYALVGSGIFPNVSLETSFGYILNSFSNNFGLGFYHLEYTFYVPEVSFFYDMNFHYYGIKAGFGLGYILGSVEETQPLTIQKFIEETKGYVFSIKSVFYSMLSQHLLVELGVNVRQAFMNDLISSNFKINRQPYDQLNLTFNSFGIKIGMRYQF